MKTIKHAGGSEASVFEHKSPVKEKTTRKMAAPKKKKKQQQPVQLQASELAFDVNNHRLPFC